MPPFVVSAVVRFRASSPVITKSGWRSFARGGRRVACAVALAAATVLRATTVVPPDFTALVNGSDVILHAITRGVESEKRVGARGVKIVTRVDLEIVEVVAGAAPAHLTLELLGGRVGDERLTVAGMPQFRVGDEDILFVSGNGRTICPLYAMMHGRYAIGHDDATGRRYVMRSDGTPLRSVAQISAPLVERAPAEAERRAAVAVALDPAEFIRQIRAAMKPDGRLNREK